MLNGHSFAAVPVNIDSERQVIGSVLYDPSRLPDVLAVAAVEDFWRDSHQAILRALRDMDAAGTPIDPFSLADELERRDELKTVGGHEALSDLIAAIPHAANAVYHAQVVRQKAIARRLLELCTRTIAAVRANQHTADELLGLTLADLVALAETGRTRGPVALADLAPRVMESIARRVEDGGPEGLSTGLADLDYLLGGMRAGQLLILAARPSMGKTSLSLNIVEHVSVECGVPVLMVTLEMDEHELVERLAVARARLDGHRVRSGLLDAGRLGTLRTAFEELARAPVWFDGDPGQDILRVLATARMLAARHQVGLVVIDYLQLLEPESDDDSRQEQVARISRRLKGLARSLKVPVLALSQLNRMVEVRPDRRPRMADLRESGAIENDADVVMLLHRPEYYDPHDQPGVAELIVAKNRSGPVGTVKLAFDRQSMRFELLARENMGGY
jgi:replicative DNA helicase